MNETIILSPRQKAIITLLSQNSHLSREQISSKIATFYPSSKATLARDISELLEAKEIKAIGNGPSRVYSSVFNHPLLRKVSLSQYFLLEPDQRQSASKSFNFQVFTQLDNLFSKTEKQELEIKFRSFNQTTKKINPTILQKELERFVIELSWKSSQIEGNTYSLLETETLIKDKKEATGHSKEEMIMILNHKDAFHQILEHQKTFKKLSISKIFELHNILVKDLGIETGIRQQAVGITGTIYRPLDNQWQIKDTLDQLVNKINGTDFPPEKALLILSMLAYLQSFNDGNKRTARMLANAILLAHDYFPLSYRSIDEDEYKKALILFYETNNLYHLKKIFLEQYDFALKTYFV